MMHRDEPQESGIAFSLYLAGRCGQVCTWAAFIKSIRYFERRLPTALVVSRPICKTELQSASARHGSAASPT